MAVHLSRRALLVGSAAATFSGPLSVEAQQSEAIRRVSALIGYAKGADEPAARQVIDPLREGLRSFGWSEEKNLHIELSFGSGDFKQTKAAADNLVAGTPDVIYAIGLPAALSVHALTQTIPIVFTQVADPVGFGLASALSRPAGNSTGFMSWDLSIGGKWVELLKEIAPAIKRVGVLYNPDTARYGPGLFASAKVIGAQHDIEVIECLVHDADEIEAKAAAIAAAQPTGLLAVPEPFINARQSTIIEIAARLHLPMIMSLGGATRRGALISYTYSTEEILRLPADYINRILRGESPGDLPIQAPTRFELSINPKTAAALGITISNSLLATADEIVD